MTNSTCMALQPSMNCRSPKSYSMNDEQHQSSCFVDSPQSQHTISNVSNAAATPVEDSMQRWVHDDDDEYSCNSSSDEASKNIKQKNKNQLSATRNNHDRILYDDDTYTQIIPHVRCSKSMNNESISSRKINFYWLPPDSYKTSKSSQNSTNVPYHNYMYVGIAHNPPMVCSEGTSRGNVRTLHRKAWLEVSDTKHRYGKHLRMYYRYWESLYILPCSSVTSNEISTKHYGTFFDWLDSTGIHNGKPLPEISDCPRSLLDSDVVSYIDDVRQSQQYAVQIVADKNGIKNLLLSNSSDLSANKSVIRTGPLGWMFVIRDNVMYAAPKVVDNGICTKRFHHSSFFGGRAVQAAGIIVTDETTGSIQHILPHSGHYRPGESDVQRILYFLYQMGVCWTTFSVDIQQFLFIDRSSKTNAIVTASTSTKCSASTSCSMKKKKVESLYLLPAVTVADFLSHKARCVQPSGLFEDIRALRCRSY